MCKLLLLAVITALVAAAKPEINDLFISEEINPIKDANENDEYKREERGSFGGYFGQSQPTASKVSTNARSSFGFHSPFGYGRGGINMGGYGSFKSPKIGRPRPPDLQAMLNRGEREQQQTLNFLKSMGPKQLPPYGSCSSYILPVNVMYNCRNEQCQVSCPHMHSFPDGTNVLKLVCIGGSWIIRNSEFMSVPPCQASCNPACQNNGICVEAGYCKCPDNFSGPLCQYKKSICASKPPIPKNSKVTCANNVCNAECMRGFRYPDGSNITNIECQDGQWVHTKSGLAKPPDCAPTCAPACANEGQCISFNVCQCSKMYRGDHCQYNVDACNITKTAFNGNYKCSYDHELTKCSLTCPDVQGLIVHGNLEEEYKCKYSEGEFYPTPLPKCIYPSGYITRPGTQKAHFVQHNGLVVSGGGIYEHLTEREKMIAVIAKYKDLEQKSEWWSSEETVVSPISYALYTTADINVTLDYSPQPAICATWGGNNVKTFDGFIYKASLSSCPHTLIIDQLDGTFDVTLKACPRGSEYGCSHSLSLYWDSILFTFENQNGTINMYTPTKKFPIPAQVMGMKVMPVAQHLLIDLVRVGLQIDWDHYQYVGVRASPVLWGRVGGLCGSLDGDYRNDLITKAGAVVETVNSFTDSWRVEDPSSTCVMENQVELEYDPKSCDTGKRKQAVSVCERLLANEKLEECMKLFNFEALLRSCIDDYCNCDNREHPESCNCNTLSTLAKECTFKGVKLEHGWRNLEICPISCNFGRVYLPCGPDVEASCESAAVPTTGKCNEGCFCPAGTVQYKEACITPELCPCKMRGKEFKPEATVKKNCNTCTCKNGQWSCTDKACGARCGAIGDPHYQTFDGKRYDFMGKCTYYMLKTSNISVETENVACSGAISENLNLSPSSENPSCTKSVTLRFIQNSGIPTAVKLDQGSFVTVNNKQIMKLPKILGNNEVLIRHVSSTFMTVEFNNGLRVWWDGISRVYIDAPPNYRDQTAGLCGTFNSNTQDDFLTPEGDIETSAGPFADKWRVKDTCDFSAQPSIVPHPCTAHPEKKSSAEKYCAWVTEDIFQDCHWTVEPEQYYEDCLYDVCACKEEPEQCYCPILSAYGAECMRQGIKTGWRLAVKECAIKCPNGQVYDECGDSCSHTCEDLATKNTCQRECVEGCRCPHGEYLNENNECVPQSKCHCSFDGMTFKAGYKEVRPGRKFLDLCTCRNGLWECEDAEPGDDKQYPPSSELKAECAMRPYAEFTKCVPKEPKTCKNMHLYVEDLDDCLPGCSCMIGYVYDTSRKMCVLPENCSCHHGGKSFSDGEKIQEDCNTCECQAGYWKCSDNGCESTCSVWGDSHFTTFDNHEFDFQGACDYVLSKGVGPNGDGFTIVIQNVLCGTMGVTCSKSVEISLTGNIQDTLTLTSDSSYLADPSKSLMKKLRDTVNAKAHGAFHIYKAGVFIVIEVVPLHLQVKWDEGTRVYVRLGNEWKNKVNGLCGNYNDNAIDDMQTPSQSPETSPLIFGHSWKVQKYCAMPTQPIDACKEHPERETWAQLKCGILKSPMFKDCHAEVPFERYLKRCIFDTCACDQGGDCECLCTAIAAYAHACSQKGINIRWRKPHFCPMQCDPQCSEYKACTPACAVETCDNFLDQSAAEHMCKNENCVEGCLIKPCEEGLIYSNDTYKDCVPKSECKPVCMVKDEKTYYEGDILYQDACSTCRCSKRKEVCSGVRCTEDIITDKPSKIIEGITLKPISDGMQSKCIKGWTRWFDNDNDSSGKLVRLNDEEKLPRYNRGETIYGTCQTKYMKDIECRVINSHEPSDFMDENVDCNLQNGLTCVGQCHDYEIRVFCQCEEKEISVFPHTEKPEIGQKCDLLMAEYKEHPEDCHRFLHCTPKSTGEWTYVEKTCGDSMMFNPVMNNCDHIRVVQELKPMCNINDTDVDVCPEGQVISDCANQCEHTCHFYGMILKKRGLCKEGEHCRPGCVPKERADCQDGGKFWRDENTCVEADECPCMDQSEKYVQPHMPFVGELEVCQCIDNAYTCVPNKVVVVTLAPVTNATPITDTTPFEEVFPATIATLKHCDTELLRPVIQGPEPLPDSVLSASSSLGPKYSPQNGRLLPSSKKQTDAWAPMINDQMQYLQVTLPEREPLFGIVMAGHPDFDNYVTLFKILYSQDGVAYHYLVDDTEMPQLFNGPLDSRIPVKALFKIPIEAKSVRIYALKWHGSIAMRVELLGCDAIDSTMIEEYVTEPSVRMPTEEYFREWEEDEKCIDEMGVDNGQMSPNQIKVSSIWRISKPAQKPRLIDSLKLSSNDGWKPMINTPNEYIEFDFLEPRNISGFITKGGPEGWVTGFKVLFSKNKLIWNTALTPEGQPKIFRANQDSDTQQISKFKTPILTQYIKIVPARWENNINMRVEPLGCFIEYPVTRDSLVEIEQPKHPKCLNCEGVVDPNSKEGDCKCQDGLYWDGSSCVQSNLCPCVENYITYPIGSKYENKDCEECVCVLGGHSNCKPKKCPPCTDNLRPVVGSGCYCKCEPCPKEQKLCPSSGDCIPEVVWCNGVQDCADDEDATCRDKYDVIPEKLVLNDTEIITCPVPECPPQMKLKLTEKKLRKMSQMFSSTFTEKYTVTREGNKVTKTKIITSSEEILPSTKQEIDFNREQACDEFICVPIPVKIIKRNETTSCPEPKCPNNYDVEVDRSTSKPGDCPRYSCILKPTKDDVCEISGKSFTTFDGIEFKYDTCSHILARDLINSSWIITVHLQCTDELRKICRKMITIKDMEKQSILTIMPNMRVNFNGFEYTVQQLINSPTCKASFVISQPGNTVLVVSPKRGFWVLYDDIGYIKIGISSKYIKTVDGLCGFYNGVASDDKRTPNGTIVANTVKFGDSWFDKRIPKEECYPQTCPLDLQKKALALCNTIKHPTFLKCGKSVNYKQFVSKCMETTCECLKASNGDAKSCKCNLLQDFVKKCLTVNPNIQLDTWRAVHMCEITCPAPLVHSDCYKRRCELSCDTLNSDDCPVISDACFSGCYCPEGTVRKGETCVTLADCKDCVCNTIGSSKYFTYDRNSFTFNGNCTYLLSRDIVLPGVHTFQVYVTMDDCHKLGRTTAPEFSSCAKSLHILNGDHVIHIQRSSDNPKALKVFVDGFEVKKLPYKDTWINLREVVGKELILTLHESHVELKAAFDDLIFSIGVSSVKYGSKMEGLCGDCDGNPNNDFQENPAKKKKRKPSQDFVDIMNSWRADEPKLGLDASECLSEEVVKEDCLPLPPEKDPCLWFFEEAIFGKCNMIVDPVIYVSACQQDICKVGNDQKGACESLSAYANECAKHGICLNWRRPDLCPYDCPSDMTYDACGCSKTCETMKLLTEFQAVNMKTSAVVNTVSSDDICPIEERFEGCFCPPGKVMENGKCIREEMCVKCEDSDHILGDRWQKDKCTECLCDKNGKTQCVEHKCSVEENICAEGYKPQKIVNEDQCCPRYACVPEPKLPPPDVCLEPIMPVCGPGQFRKQKTGPDGCPQYICECKPKEDCDPLEPVGYLKYGQTVVKEEIGCCPTQKVICDKTTCLPKPPKCGMEFYEVYTKQEPDDCCPSYECGPPKDLCIVDYGPGKKFTKKIAEKWIDPRDPCKHEMCAYGPNDSTQVITTTDICEKKCLKGFKYVNADPIKCCGECIQTACLHHDVLYEPEDIWKSEDNCTTYKCTKVGTSLIVNSAQETCPDVSQCFGELLEDEGGCCKICKETPKSEYLKNCLPLSLADTETVNLIKVFKPGHGHCKNNQPILGFTECMGTCNSGSKYNELTYAHDKVCHCCNIKSYKKIAVPLTCADGVQFIKELDIPAACGCQPCSDSGEYHTDNFLDVRLQPLPLAQLIERH
ncbi:hemocytin [Glossina fuscipes]|uniref:Hemocytin n=1 Tax=Glossina fuscipes TaxID=7396 RepID=A0A9C6E4B4_9MUSC|nr:hemocytin [Glossina fuscipes]